MSGQTGAWLCPWPLTLWPPTLWPPRCWRPCRRLDPRRDRCRGRPIGIVRRMLIEGIPLWVAQTNCWIVAPQGPGGEAVLIDAPPDPASIVTRLKEHGLKLVAIFNTHGHLDHIGGVGSLVHGTEGGHEIDVRINRHDR